MHYQHQESDYYSSIYYGVMHGFSVLEAHAANCCLRQTENAETDQDPETHHVRFGCNASLIRSRPAWIDRIQFVHDAVHAASNMDYRPHDDESSDHHYYSLYGVCSDYGFETAEACVDYHDDSEEYQTINI